VDISVGAPYYEVHVHLRLAIPKRDVANERKQFQLFAKHAGWIVLFLFPN
jgi:hypothetical protein